MAQEIKIEIEPESYAEVYGKLLALYKMAERIDSVMQSAQQSVHQTAYGRIVWAFCAGFLFGLLACLAAIGGG